MQKAIKISLAAAIFAVSASALKIDIELQKKGKKGEKGEKGMKGSKGRRDQGALSLGNLLGGRRPRLTCEQKQEALIDKLTTECGEDAGCLAIVTAFEEELVTCDELQAAQDVISDA